MKQLKKTGSILSGLQLHGTSELTGTLQVSDQLSMQVSFEKLSHKKNNAWYPEQFMLAVAGTAFMRQFYLLAKKEELPVSRFTCDVIGDMQVTSDESTLSCINIYPTIFIENKTLTGQTKLLLEKAIHNAYVTSILHTIIYYHPLIKINKSEKNSTISKHKNRKNEIRNKQPDYNVTG